MIEFSVKDRSRVTLLWILCPLIAIASFRFLLGGVAETMSDFVYHAELRPLAFYSHITLASVALALVPFQLWGHLRRRKIQAHRALGRVYALAIVVSGIGGLWLAITTQAGLAASMGFAALAVAWVGTTSVGVIRAMRGDTTGHQRWMVRSAALTMAAVTLRIYLLLAALSGFSYEDVSGVIAWACWIPNLAAAELSISRCTIGAMARLVTDHKMTV